MKIKIPNDFFYNGGRKIKKIGGEQGFALYCLITVLKNVNNNVYITTNGLNNLLRLDKNAFRGRKKVSELLLKLKVGKLIDFSGAIPDSGNTFFTIKWINKFADKSTTGWTFFTGSDWSYFDELGITTYSVMWLIRMFTNHKSQTSFVSYRNMADILDKGVSSVISSVNELEDKGYIEVERSDGYFYNAQIDKEVKLNNTYRWIGRR